MITILGRLDGSEKKIEEMFQAEKSSFQLGKYQHQVC